MKKPPISGPATDGDAEDGAEQAHVACPRSRGETTSPIAAWALTIRPPPPSPWIARNAISSVIP